MSQDVEAAVQHQAELDQKIESTIARRRRTRRRLIVAAAGLLVLLVAILVWQVVQTVSVPAPEAADYFEQAVQRQQQGDTQGAIRLLKQVLQSHPDHVEARWRLGQSYLLVGDGRAAEKELRHARLLGQQGEDIQHALLEAMLLDRRYTELLIETIGLAGGNSPHKTRLMRAEAQLGLKRYDKALETLDEVLAEQSDDPAAARVLARVYLATGDVGAAEAALGRVSADTSESAEFKLLRARVALARGSNEQARTLFNDFLAMAGDHPEGRLGKAQAFLAEGNPDQALQELERISQPDTDIVRYLAAVAYSQKGDVQSARAEIRRFLQRQPDHLDGLMLMARMNLLQQEYRQAETSLTRLLNASPNDVTVLHELAALYLELEQPSDAELMLQRATEAGGEDSKLLALKARAAITAGEQQQAEEYLARATEHATEEAAMPDTGPVAAEGRLERCGVLVHYCRQCLFIRECR